MDNWTKQVTTKLKLGTTKPEKLGTTKPEKLGTTKPAEASERWS